MEKDKSTNTSIKFPLSIKISNNNKRIETFEKNLGDIDLIYDFYISRSNKDFTYYQIIFNDPPNIFLEIMKEKNYNFDTQNKIWSLN